MSYTCSSTVRLALLPVSSARLPTRSAFGPEVSSSGGATLRSAGLASEIDLRGLEAMEAVLSAERYLDSAVMARLSSVRIIHGKGTGVLRQAIQDMLRKNKHVKSFRLGEFGEGDRGVTIVTFKE